MTPQRDHFSLSAFAIHNPHFTIVAFLIFLILGVWAFLILPKDLLPASKLPAVQIVSFYPGMPVGHVEQDLTYLYERYTGQAVGIKSQESRSLMGVSIVRNYFDSNIDLSSAVAQTGALVMSVLRKLPPGTQPPLIMPFDPMASVPLALCAVGGEHKTQSELQDLARYSVINAIQGVQGAMAPSVMGGETRAAVIYLDPVKLQLFNLSPVNVLNKLTSMNTFIPVGDIKVKGLDYQIISNGLVERIEDMNDFYLRSQNGVPVRLKDVGHAEDSHSIQTNAVFIDGKPEVYVPIYRQPGSNSLAVVDDVRKALKNLEASLSGFKLSVVIDQSIFIRKAISSLSEEVTLGGGIAALMVFLFLGSFQATIAVLLSLPISLVAVFLCLAPLGKTLNLMTLGGLGLSVGVLVDNAIVVIEVIMQKISEGRTPLVASLEGSEEVAMPVLASTISILIVFFPVLLLSGITQILFSALSLTVIAAMVASYFSSLMLIPLYASRFLKPIHHQKGELLGRIQILLSRMTESYEWSLKWALVRSRVILPISFGFFVLAAVVFVPKIGVELFPRPDSGGFQIHVRGLTGQQIEDTKILINKIEKKLREYILPQDLEMIISNAGVYYGYAAAYTSNSGSQDAFFKVQLTDRREHTSQYYAQRIREKFPTDFPYIEFGVELGGLLTSALNGGLPSPIDVQIGGAQAEVSHRYATRILDKIKAISGAVDARIQQRFDAPGLKLNLDREKASRVGLTAEEIVKNVVSAVSNSSTFNQEIWIDPKTGIDYLLGVQFAEKDVSTFQQFLNIPITGPNQNRSVPLRALATTHYIRGPTELNHKDLLSVVDIYLDAQGRDIGGVARDVQKILDANPLPKGYSSSLRGEIATINESLAPLCQGFLLAALLVYLILVVQFRSFLLPAIIMTTVPMGMVGVILMMALTHTYFSIQAAIGCIFVIGVAVSHGVLLLQYIVEQSKQVPTVDEAIILGARARLRPILMTSLASIFGLLPMALGLGQGSEAGIPLGRAVIGGQILSTLLNFYLVPAVFRVVYQRFICH